MNRRIGVIAIAVAILMPSFGASAQVITLSYVAAATAVDDGPQDGIFDAFTVPNFGSVNNNGYASFRTALEFQMPAVPPGSKIRSAVLTGEIGIPEGNRHIAVYGYSGDGVIQLADFGLGTPVGSTSLSQGNYSLMFDVTPLVKSLAAADGGFARFNLREEPANAPNYIVMFLGMSTMRLNIVIASPPAISKAFADSSISLDGTTALMFTITNPNATLAQTGITFTDDLPAGLQVASAPSLSNTCGGSVAAPAGSSSVSLTGGTLAPGATCSISVRVQGTTAGFKSNSVTIAATEDGTGNTSTAEVEVVTAPLLAKSFVPNRVFAGETTMLIFTLSNAVANHATLTGVGFADQLAAGLSVSNGSAPGCGGTVTTTGQSMITLTGATIAVGATCQVSVPVVTATPGSFTNTTGPVRSTNGGVGNTASDNILVVARPAIPTVNGLGVAVIAGLLLIAGLGRLRNHQA